MLAHLGGFGGSFGKGLETLGAFWVVLEALCFMLKVFHSMCFSPLPIHDAPDANGDPIQWPPPDDI